LGGRKGRARLDLAPFLPSSTTLLENFLSRLQHPRVHTSLQRTPRFLTSSHDPKPFFLHAQTLPSFELISSRPFTFPSLPFLRWILLTTTEKVTSFSWPLALLHEITVAYEAVLSPDLQRALKRRGVEDHCISLFDDLEKVRRFLSISSRITSSLTSFLPCSFSFSIWISSRNRFELRRSRRNRSEREPTVRSLQAPPPSSCSFRLVFSPLLSQLFVRYSSSPIPSSTTSSPLRAHQAHPILHRRSSSDPNSRRSLSSELVRSNLPLRPDRQPRREIVKGTLSSLGSRKTSTKSFGRRVGQIELEGDCSERRNSTRVQRTSRLLVADGEIVRVVSMEWYVQTLPAPEERKGRTDPKEVVVFF